VDVTEDGFVPVTYKIDTEKRVIRTKCSGDVTLQEVIDHFKSLSEDQACPTRLDVMLDLSEADSLPETSHLRRVVGELRAIRGQVCFGACAILACRDALFGMMRVFEALAAEFFRTTCTFREAADAEAWLVSQQSHENN
jgi:hypothetical protein